MGSASTRRPLPAIARQDDDHRCHRRGHPDRASRKLGADRIERLVVDVEHGPQRDGLERLGACRIDQHHIHAPPILDDRRDRHQRLIGSDPVTVGGPAPRRSPG